MPIWTFCDYVEASGKVPFNDWLSTLPAEAQAFVDARILQMAGLAKWPEKWASSLAGYDKLIELRVTHKKVQYRPLGIYAPGHRFILLGGAIEKDDNLPRDTIHATVRRQQSLAAGNGYVRHHSFNQSPTLGEDAR